MLTESLGSLGQVTTKKKNHAKKGVLLEPVLTAT